MDGRNNFPKLHNAMWPGLVGKGPDSEPPIGLDEMLDLTAATDVGGIKFEGVDLFLAEPHTSIDSSKDEIKRLADKIAAKNLEVGSVVAPVWPPVGGGSAMGSETDRQRFVDMVRKACGIARQLRELGIRKGGVVRIDSAASVEDWAKDPPGNTRTIADTFRRACDVAEEHGERLAAEGEICWGGMHSWQAMVDLLEQVDRPKTLGFQADMAHTLLYTLGYNAPEDRILPADFDWKEQEVLDRALKTLTDALRPWTNRFPRRAERCDGEGHGLPRQDRPALSGQRSQRQARRRARRRLLAARCRGQAHARRPPHLLGWLHVPERGDATAADLERCA